MTRSLFFTFRDSLGETANFIKYTGKFQALWLVIVSDRYFFSWWELFRVHQMDYLIYILMELSTAISKQAMWWSMGTSRRRKVFIVKKLASDWSINENWYQLRHIENNHVEKNSDSENVRWWALELFYDPIVSFATTHGPWVMVLPHFSHCCRKLQFLIKKYLESQICSIYKRNWYLEFWCFDVGDSHFGENAVFKYCYQRYSASC